MVVCNKLHGTSMENSFTNKIHKTDSPHIWRIEIKLLAFFLWVSFIFIIVWDLLNGFTECMVESTTVRLIFR